MECCFIKGSRRASFGIRIKKIVIYTNSDIIKELEDNFPEEKMNRNSLITISGAALLSFGLLTGVTNNSEVSAAVKVGQSNRLERNAYIYNSRAIGQRRMFGSMARKSWF